MVTVTTPGYVRLDLSPEVLDAALPGQIDVRLIDPQGRETPYDWVRATPPVASRPFTARHDVKVTDRATIVTITTGTTEALAYAALETASGDFFKPADVELSSDGEHWTTLVKGRPLFRRGATTRGEVPLQGQTAAFIRITLNDLKTPPLAITGAVLALAPTGVVPPRTVTQPVEISQREEFASETVLTLDLGAAHLPLAAWEFDSPTAVFSRGVTLAERRLQDEVLAEHILARGMLSRRPADAVSTPAVWELGTGLTAQREVILHIDNGDSPPLPLTGITLRRLKHELVFNAPQAGPWTLLVGNPTAVAPRYDFARFSSELGTAPVDVAVGRLASNPAYQTPPDALADVPLPGAKLDPLSWKFRRPVILTSPGVQQLELDLGVLARSRADLADIRLISGGQQIPYLIERSALSREFAATIEPADDSRRPRTSRWRVKFPQPSLPLRRVVLASSTPLFQRSLRLTEPVADERGQESVRLLAEATWVRQPGRPASNLVFPINDRLAGDTLYIEADNDDNPPIALTSVRGAVGVTRLLFKPAPDVTTPEIIYGNPEAVAARYDLVLIAPHILGAPKHSATLGAETPTATALDLFSGRGSVVFFWGVLALVVVILFVIVARLLPKPTDANATK